MVHLSGLDSHVKHPFPESWWEFYDPKENKENSPILVRNSFLQAVEIGKNQSVQGIEVEYTEQKQPTKT